MAREVDEETGYRIELDSTRAIFVGDSNFYHRTEKKFYRSIRLFYKGKLLDENREVNSMNEKRVEWVDISTLDERNCHPIVMPVLGFLS